MSISPLKESLVSLSFFHALSHIHISLSLSFSPLSCLVIELSCFFSPTIPLPLRVTSSSFIVRVTVFRRSDHVMISRSHSPLFYGTNGRAAVFFKVSRTSETVPFIIDIPLPCTALRLRLVIVSNANQQMPSIDQSSSSKCRLICWLSTHRTLLLSLASLGFLFVTYLWYPRNFTLFHIQNS